MGRNSLEDKGAHGLIGLGGLSVTVVAERGLVDDAFCGYTFSTEMFAARVAEPSMVRTSDCTAVFADCSRGSAAS